MTQRVSDEQAQAVLDRWKVPDGMNPNEHALIIRVKGLESLVTWESLAADHRDFAAEIATLRAELAALKKHVAATERNFDGAQSVAKEAREQLAREKGTSERAQTNASRFLNERDDARAELAACTEERDRLLAEMRGRDALVVDLAAQRDARTEELRLARNYMGALLGIIDGDTERVESAREVLGCYSRLNLLDEAQAFVSAP